MNLSADELGRLYRNWRAKRTPPAIVNRAVSDAEVGRKLFGCFQGGSINDCQQLLWVQPDGTQVDLRQKPKEERGEPTMAKKCYDSASDEQLDKLLNKLERLIALIAKDMPKEEELRDADLIPVPEVSGKAAKGVNPITHAEDHSYEDMLKFYRQRGFSEGKHAADKANPAPRAALMANDGSGPSHAGMSNGDFEASVRRQRDGAWAVDHRKKLR